MPRLADAMPSILDALADSDRPARSGLKPAHEVGTFAAVAAAYLSRFVDDRAVMAGIDALRESGRLEPGALADADPDEVADDWRASGARSLVKLARPLLKVARWAADQLDDEGRIGGSASTEALREGLRAIKGVGPATTDAILLEGLGRSAYPVDRASYRILVRHGWIDAGAPSSRPRSATIRPDSAGSRPGSNASVARPAAPASPGATAARSALSCPKAGRSARNRAGPLHLGGAGVGVGVGMVSSPEMTGSLLAASAFFRMVSDWMTWSR
jgi:endonuclease III